MKTLTLLAAATVLGATIAGPVAAEFSGERSVTGPRGNGATVETEVTRTETGRTTSVTGTTSGGQGWSREAVISRDPETGTRTREGSGATTGGATWASSGSRTCADGACEGSGSRVGPRGGETSWSGSAVRTGDGTVEGTGSWIGPRGGTGTRDWTWRRVLRGGS